jgi:hypothetical protein
MQIEMVEIAKLELERGDILFCRFPEDWSEEKQRLAQECIEEMIRDTGARLLCGPKSVEFQILSKGAGKLNLPDLRHLTAGEAKCQIKADLESR